jgi:hypothetical protein
MWVFSRIVPPAPVTTILGAGDARWERERRVETNVGMADAFALAYINDFGVPVSMGLAVAALFLAFLGWPRRRFDRCLSVVSGVWLLLLFVVGVRLGHAGQVDAQRLRAVAERMKH